MSKLIVKRIPGRGSSEGYAVIQMRSPRGLITLGACAPGVPIAEIKAECRRLNREVVSPLCGTWRAQETRLDAARRALRDAGMLRPNRRSIAKPRKPLASVSAGVQADTDISAADYRLIATTIQHNCLMAKLAEEERFLFRGVTTPSNTETRRS